MSSLEDGFRSYTNNAGINMAAFGGTDYVRDVELTIDEMDYLINVILRYNLKGAIKGTKPAQLKGDAAEYWHMCTHNIDAAVKDVKAHTEVLRSHVSGSIDVQGNWKDGAYGLKYIKTGEASAKAQAEIYRAKHEKFNRNRIEKGLEPISYKEYFQDEYQKYLKECKANNRDPKSFEAMFPGVNDKNNPLYSGQYRLIPKDQIEEARSWLNHKILEAQNGGRSEQVKRYQETLNKLTDRIKSNEGSESIPLSREEAEQIARLAKDGNFDPSAWGLSAEELIKWQNIMQQAYKAGLSAAVISVVLEVAPELIKILTELFRYGEVNPNDFKRLGFAALKGGLLGYVRGSVAAAITVACKSGKLGATLRQVDPTVIGAVVALTMNTLQNATLMAFGKMDRNEFANRCIQDLFTTSCSLLLGSALQAMIPALPVLGYMLGSFIGGVVGSFAYQEAYNCILSFCVDTGCTFFGLVEQDYTLPKDVLEELGLSVFEYEDFEHKTFEYEKFEFETFEYDTFEYTHINIRFVRRGVIGVNAVGFVM